MRLLPGHWLPHTVTVTPYLGEGGNGPLYGEAATVAAFVEDVREVVVDASGVEVVSNTKIHMQFADAPAEQSKVTVWAGTSAERTAPVVQVGRNEHPRFVGYAVVRLR